MWLVASVSENTVSTKGSENSRLTFHHFHCYFIWKLDESLSADINCRCGDLTKAEWLFEKTLNQ